MYSNVQTYSIVSSVEFTRQDGVYFEMLWDSPCQSSWAWWSWRAEHMSMLRNKVLIKLYICILHHSKFQPLFYWHMWELLELFSTGRSSAYLEFPMPDLSAWCMTGDRTMSQWWRRQRVSTLWTDSLWLERKFWSVHWIAEAESLMQSLTLIKITVLQCEPDFFFGHPGLVP